MAQEDFDINSLAKYLHLTAAQVSKMADRDKIPGRKISGQWKFSPAEIHHWLEERIGVSDEEGLVRVENVLERSVAADQTESLSLAELLSVEAVAAPLGARTRSSVITSMTGLAAAAGLLWDPDKMAEAIRNRENLHPTALDNGVALLHPRRPMPSILAHACLSLGRTSQGIPFGGRGLTDVFFLICSTSDSEHLRVLARLSRLVADVSMMEEIRSAPNAKSIHQIIIDWETGQ